MIQNNFANGLGKEEIEFLIIFLSELRIDWLSYKYLLLIGRFILLTDYYTNFKI